VGNSRETRKRDASNSERQASSRRDKLATVGTREQQERQQHKRQEQLSSQ